jgi:hypothetical protein
MSDAAPERIWLGRDSRYVGSPWIRLASEFEDDECGDDVAEYVRLALHTAALAERDARLAALAAQRDRLFGLLMHWQSYGCPACGGDCSAANPPVIGCLMQEATAALQPRALLDGGKASK